MGAGVVDGGDLTAEDEVGVEKYDWDMTEGGGIVGGVEDIEGDLDEGGEGVYSIYEK